MQLNYEGKRGAIIPWSFLLGSTINHKELLQEHLKESMSATATHLGVSFTGLEKKMYMEGLVFNRKKPFTTKIKELGNKAKNMTSDEIGKIVGCSIQTASRTCREHKIKYKKRDGLDNLWGKKKGVS